MIIDTTYLLPLARIDVDTDLLKAVAGKKATIKFDQISVSLISIFELQAKAAKLSVSPRYVIRGIEAIFNAFRVHPFHTPEVIRLGDELRRQIDDYVDCILVATAAARKEGLITEDTKITEKAKTIEQRYRIKVLKYDDLIGKPAPASR